MTPHPGNRSWDNPCTALHAYKLDGQPWQRGDDDALGTHTMGNGVTHYRLRCNKCGQQSGAVPTVLAAEWMRAGEPLAWQTAKTPNTYAPCSYQGCTNPGMHAHHTAPRNTFGPEAEHYPVVYLCQAHHTHWHQRMDGYRWQARRAS